MQDNNNDSFIRNIEFLRRVLRSQRVLLLVSFYMAQLTCANATVQDWPVRTDPGQPIEIDLFNVITNVTNPVVQIVQPGPSNGTITPCQTPSDVCFTYTPNAGFVGIEFFDYSVLNDAGTPEFATLTIAVGNVTVQNQGRLVPTTETNKVLAQDCPLGDTRLACTDYHTATDGVPEADLKVLLDPITPDEVAAQGTIGNVLASDQLTNVGKHLAALRKGQKIASVGGLAFNVDGKTISGDMLAGLINGESRGGAASADSVNGRWGWFINGNIGGGDQDESDFENGFTFKSNGVSTGADYRFGALGVLGAALGISATSLDMNNDQGGLEAQGLSFIAYGSLYPTPNSYLDVIVSINSTAFDSERRIDFGTTDEIAFSSNDSQTTALSVAGGFNLVNSGGFSANIDLKGEFINSTIDGYSETGNSPYNVTIAERDVSQVTSSLGSTMTYAISTPTAVWIPQMDIFWVHQFEEEADVIEAYFNFTTDPNLNTFRFNTNLPDADFFKLDLGLSMINTGGTTAFAQFGTTVSRTDYQNWHLAFGLRMEL